MIICPSLFTCYDVIPSRTLLPAFGDSNIDSPLGLLTSTNFKPLNVTSGGLHCVD
ncbi:uncharacterized protein PHALS_09191 [Plasmopara halstedii]|uniref:Uncharacterized protein n=1 Tax=Plasmopara halstedii TaxID=4781 RepID=A0A0P1AEZ2_PLAHL|nr:uncharacterized protein PHALS_09191 [Plasmopara halstedii]CEG39135.1 hypothetical protein PHALS_09191 [Plasmopara halstedii]|eukprot:XP_024575504.1 hypothetical protein PHALS_09191 [Plasmopara halstedii]